MRLDLNLAAGWIAGAHLIPTPGSVAPVVSGVGTDTRAIPVGSLFVALRGERFDAHDFVADAVAGGAAALMVEREVPAAALPRPVPQLVVPDTARALGELAAGWRARFVLPLIAVAGSNGKTTVKAMVAAILAAAHGDAHAHATRGNLNNHIGVPMTVLALTDAHRASVVELGMNHVGEIDWLARIAQPTVALVNNAQREHQEFLDGVEATARENGSAIAALGAEGVAVFPADDPCTPIWRALAGTRRVVDFAVVPTGAPATAAVTADADADPAGFEIRLRGAAADALAGPVAIRVALAIEGPHNVRNALAAAACCAAIGVPPATIAAGLAAFRPVAGRLVRHARPDGAIVIDDTYNANPDSVRAAIDLLAAGHAGRRTVLVLGDMGEVGARGPEFHAEVGAWAHARGITTLLATGPLSAAAVQGWADAGGRLLAAVAGTAGSSTVPSGAASGDLVGAGEGGALHCATIDAAIATARVAAGPGTTVLVKGSRFMRMERVVNALLDGTAGEAVRGHD